MDDCILWDGPRDRDGYGRGVRSRSGAHREAWESVNGRIPPGLHVLHRCDVPACVNVEHLFLGTNADNVADRCAKGRTARGEYVGGSKLTEAAVSQILAEREVTPYADLAERYGIAPQTVSQICCGRTWRHVPGERGTLRPATVPIPADGTRLRRFEAKVGPPDESGCLPWLGSLQPSGYGRIRVGDRAVFAHRLAWELAFGRPLPPGACVKHTCERRDCVNPAHLELGKPGRRAKR